MGKIIENYSLQHELGSGVYSRVYKAINLKNKQQVAIKMVKADKFKQLPKLEEGTVNEINILSNLQYCPHIIKYYDMLKTVNNFYFVYQFCNGGTLENLLKKENILSEKVALTYFAQILEAFKVLNKNNIMHRDLKPDNILIHDGILKLADFGFCKPLQSLNEMTGTMLGSPLYMAPQILKGQSYSIKADIWSLGVVLFRMLYGYCPFNSANIGKLILLIQQEQLKIPTTPVVSPRTVQLLSKMLTKNAHNRAEWSEIFSYEIVNGEITKSSFINSSKGKALTDSGLKHSLSPTVESSTSPKLEPHNSFSYSTKDFNKTQNSKNKNQEEYGANYMENSVKNEKKQDILYNPKDKMMRNTYTTKSPLRQNLKKDMMLKNHSKCIQFTSIMIGLCKYQCLESLLLAYLFAENIEKQLNAILDSIRKQGQIRSVDQTFMKTFYNMIQSEIDQIHTHMDSLKEQAKFLGQESLDKLETYKKQIMKKFISSLKLENSVELVLASRVLDLLEDSLVIRKQTYERMSKDQLLKKIKDKMQTI